MTPKEFINNVVESIDSLVSLYSKGSQGPTYLGSELDKLGLSTVQREKVLDLIQLAVGEATHSLICGIEGTSALGKNQKTYKLFDDAGNELTGKLDTLLYEKLKD